MVMVTMCVVRLITVRTEVMTVMWVATTAAVAIVMCGSYS